MSSGVLHARSPAAASRRKQSSRYAPRRSQPTAPTRIFFIRHGSHDLIDHVLVGRMPDVPLSAVGVEEVRRLAGRMAGMNITRVHTSPRQRAIETARIIARQAGVPMEISFALDEIDAGAWTGLSFAELAKEPSWNFWNMLRSLARPPEGESMREVQDRVAAYLARVHVAHPGACIAMVSHAEVIRTAVMHCEGLSLDAFAEVRISPGQVIEMIVSAHGARLAARDEAG